MPMAVMRIRHMRMGMPHRPVPVPMAVLAHGHRLVHMVMVPVVVAVGMLVLQRLVFMLVGV